MGKGNDAQAVDVVHKVAKYNGKTSSLSLEDLQQVDKKFDEKSDGDDVVAYDSTGQVLKRHLSALDGNHVKPLFATRKLAISTTLLIILWGIIISSDSCKPIHDFHLSADRPCLPAVSTLSCDMLSLISFSIETLRFRYNSFVTY